MCRPGLRLGWPGLGAQCRVWIWGFRVGGWGKGSRAGSSSPAQPLSAAAVPAAGCRSWAGEGLEALLPLEASLSSGAAEVEVQLEASREGGYVGRYTPCQPGFYRLHLACRGAPLPGTPFSVQVRG